MFDYVYKTVFGLPTILGINNEFNTSSISLIGSNDTLIIQEYFIEMKITSLKTGTLPGLVSDF